MVSSRQQNFNFVKITHLLLQPTVAVLWVPALGAVCWASRVNPQATTELPVTCEADSKPVNIPISIINHCDQRREGKEQDALREHWWSDLAQASGSGRGFWQGDICAEVWGWGGARPGQSGREDTSGQGHSRDEFWVRLWSCFPNAPFVNQFCVSGRSVWLEFLTFQQLRVLAYESSIRLPAIDTLCDLGTAAS